MQNHQFTIRLYSFIKRIQKSNGTESHEGLVQMVSHFKQLICRWTAIDFPKKTLVPRSDDMFLQHHPHNQQEQAELCIGHLLRVFFSQSEATNTKKRWVTSMKSWLVDDTGFLSNKRAATFMLHNEERKLSVTDIYILIWQSSMICKWKLGATILRQSCHPWLQLKQRLVFVRY